MLVTPGLAFRGRGTGDERHGFEREICVLHGVRLRYWPPTSSRGREADPTASVVATLVVDLEDPHGPRAARGREVRAAARLAIEPDDLNDAHHAVRVGGRRYRAIANQPGLRDGVVRGNVAIADGQILADDASRSETRDSYVGLLRIWP